MGALRIVEPVGVEGGRDDRASVRDRHDGRDQGGAGESANHLAKVWRHWLAAVLKYCAFARS